MANNFEDKMVLFAKRNNLKMDWQTMQGGYRRARITCDSYEELSAVLRIAHRIKGAWVGFKSYFEGEFEGNVYVMDAEERRKAKEENEREQRRLEDWWARYRFADAETRRLMACGAIE